jgi:hypothetical protein
MSEPIDPSSREPLSPEGRQRQEAILRAAIGLGRRRRRNRIARRAAIVVAPLIAVAMFAALHPESKSKIAEMPSTAPTDHVVVATKPEHVVVPDSVIASTAAVRIERIADDPAIVARYTAPSISKITIERIDDNQLFQELAAANLRGGLATIAGQTRLVLSR